MLSWGVMSVYADRLSPDTRVRLGQIVRTQSTDVSEPSISVFIAFEDGYDASVVDDIAGVEIQSDFGTIVTALVSPDAIESLSNREGVRYVQMSSDVRLLNDFARRELHVNDVHTNAKHTLPQGYRGTGVIVGMIDTGIEYGHRAFYNSTGKMLRIKRVWDQNVSSSNPPAGFTYGTEFTTQAQILEATTDSRSQIHGCHTTGTAAGGGNLTTPYYGMAPDADIVFVSFKNDDNISIADAIKYIFDYADECGLPCVINMSLGSHHGPHDGTSYLDRIIDNLTGPGHIIVGAVGNEGESRMHATKTFGETDTTMKTFMTFNENQYQKYQYIDIWGTPGSDLKVKIAVFNSLKGQTVSVSDAFDTSAGSQPVGYFTYLDEVGVDMDAVIYGEINPENNAPHVWIQSNVSNVGQGRMPGLIIEGTPGSTVHMWNEGLNEFSSNNKAGFTDGDHNCTVGEIGGTAKRIITVGSYDGRDTLPINRNYWIDMTQAFSSYKKYNHSVFSSYGPTADGRIVPHILAPGIPVVSACNRYGINSQELEAYYSDYTTDVSGRKSYYIYNMGTSMSAPHVAGIVALMLQANPDLTPEQCRGIIQSTADTWDDMGELPNNAYGAGRINALRCVEEALKLGEEVYVADIAVDTDATRVWALDGYIKVMTPAVGSTLRLYGLTGTLLAQQVLDATSTTIDGSQWGPGIVIAEIVGENSRRTFKIAL